MMKMSKVKGFVMGVITTIAVFSMVFSVYALTGTTSLSATYKNIKLVVNGSTVTPKDANGNTVEPFVVNGTTYLPVRAVATALNKNVSWNSTTNTVSISDVKSGSGSNSTNSSTGYTSKNIADNTVVFNSNNIKVTYLNCKRESLYNGEWYDTYEFKIENNSTIECGVTSDNVTIDGIQDYGSLAEEVSAGNTAYATFTVYKSSLQEYQHLNDYNAIRLRLHIYDTNNIFSGYSAYSSYFTM
jgi:hypothetical protein